MAQLIFPFINFGVKIVAANEIINLIESGVVYFGTFKFAASGPSQAMSPPLVVLMNNARAEQDVRSKEFSFTWCLSLLFGEMQYNKILI